MITRLDAKDGLAEPVEQLFQALQKKLDLLQGVVPEEYPRLALEIVNRVQSVATHRFSVVRQEIQTKAASEC